jgi:hypothetical protein
MRTSVFSLIIIFSVLLLNQSCKEKCYECTRKCGTCTKGFTILFGCDGDSALTGNSADSWIIYLERQGYSCRYNNIVEKNVCEKGDKKSLENNHYSCKKQ